MNVFHLFVEVVVPVFFIFFIGFIIQRWKRLDLKAVSTVSIYVLSPALVFSTFYRAHFNIEYVQMVVFSMLFLVTFIFLSKIYCLWRGHTRTMESGLILATAFMNAGNYGAPIILFAFGEEGFYYAVSFMVIQSVVMNVFGVYYAFRGQAGARQAFQKVLQMPATYAVITAILCQFLPWELPNNVMMPVDLIADAAIPVAMLLLGMQLAELKLGKVDKLDVTFASMSRLFLSPIIAYVFLSFLKTNELLEAVLIILVSMPTAVTTTMYAVQFNAKPILVSSITFVTTLMSIGSITILLALLSG
ncbi:AEC family transporter [Bacillus sp. FJAT-47783]|uniref:AEC family transporter n=1 Tax=Bacillus sp. FJAT-47783 TaxID=2922712 RepID=UPI001FAE13A1|nr:AEC family transporter [Bacillus sp. FJAT-47783]